LNPLSSNTSAHLLDSNDTPSVPAKRVETNPMFLPILQKPVNQFSLIGISAPINRLRAHLPLQSNETVEKAGS
jgi:hypothetical protein